MLRGAEKSTFGCGFSAWRQRDSCLIRHSVVYLSIQEIGSMCAHITYPNRPPLPMLCHRELHSRHLRAWYCIRVKTKFSEWLTISVRYRSAQDTPCVAHVTHLSMPNCFSASTSSSWPSAYSASTSTFFLFKKLISSGLEDTMILLCWLDNYYLWQH